MSAKGDAQAKVQRSKVCVFAGKVAPRLHLQLKIWAKKQHLVDLHLEFLEPVGFMTPLPHPQLFFIQYSRRSESERSEKTTHAGHIVCFFDKQ